MSATIETKIWLALRARLEALTLSPALHIAWPNEAFSPVVGTSYLEATHFPNAVQRQYLKGSDPHFYQGIFQITLHAPLNKVQGYAQATETAGLIAEHFAAGQRMYYDNIAVRVAKHPNVLSGRSSGTYFDIPISIDYYIEA